MTYVLLNPPSAPGTTANREGAGGLGVVTPTRGGFVYPSLLLAELAGSLTARGLQVLVEDHVLGRPWPWVRARRHGAHLVVRSSAATLDWDLAWLRRQPAVWSTLTIVAPGVSELAEAPPAANLRPDGNGHHLAAALTGQPTPAPNAAPFADFDRVPLGRTRRPSLFHARGCWHGCSYCPYVVATGRTVISRSPERTAQEFVHLVRAHRPKRMVFRDPTFGLEPSTTELVERIAALPRSERAPFEVETRPEVASDELIDALALAGCVELKLGVESFHGPTLVRLGRIPSLDAVRNYEAEVDRALARCRERGLPVRLFLLSGLPGPDAARDPGRFDSVAAIVSKPLSRWPRVGSLTSEFP